MLIRQSWLRQKLRSAALMLFAFLENNGNTTFETNGEKQFIDNVFNYFKSNKKLKCTILDIGANVGGYSSMLVEKSVSMGIPIEVHLFEPTQACFKTLENKFAATPGIILNKKAISDSKGAVSIYYDEEKSGLASLYKRNLAAYSIALDQSETIETMRLDTYLQEAGIQHVDLLKIDIEGHEIPAFFGMGAFLDNRFVDFIQFEYGGANLDSHTSLMDLYALFEAKGFLVAKILPKGLEIRSYEPWMDNFNYANYVAVSSHVIGQL